ncbi:MAG: (d)CMP kinase, partial [Janthinobacterium lividum]
KLFVTASPDVRAARRAAELARAGHALSHETVLGDILARDARDSGRHAAPLTMATDAVLLDTTNLDIGSAVAQAIALVEARLRGG